MSKNTTLHPNGPQVSKNQNSHLKDSPIPSDQTLRNIMQYSSALWSRKTSKGYIHCLMN